MFKNFDIVVDVVVDFDTVVVFDIDNDDNDFNNESDDLNDCCDIERGEIVVAANDDCCLLLTSELVDEILSVEA